MSSENTCATSLLVPGSSKSGYCTGENTPGAAFVTNKKHSPTVPGQEKQRGSSSSNKGESSHHQTSTATGQIQGQSGKAAGQAQHSSENSKILCLKAAPKAQQRGPRSNFSQLGCFSAA